MKNSLTLLLVLSLYLFAPLRAQSPAGPFETARQAADHMRIGWNLGNTLDAHGRRDTLVLSPTYWETLWHQPVTTRAMMHAFKERGFGVIRIPVTWYPHLDADNRVDDAWMQRVEEIVGYVLDEGLYCILNVHHDTGTRGWLKSDPERYPAISARFKALWQQIATRFADYDQRLLFEAYNEMLDRDGHWDSTEPANYTAINRLAQDFVDVVRQSGGRNEWRNLLITTYSANGGDVTLSHYRLPQDVHPDHLLAEVHFYDPQEFCFPEHQPTEYTDAYREISRQVIERVADHFDALGVPVVIGEIAAFDKHNTPERVKFSRFVASETHRRGIVLVWWMGLLNRHTCQWDEPEIVDALMEGIQ